jgi:hypothetical protein
MKRVFLLLTAAAMVFTSCKKEGRKGGIFKGPVQKFQHGSAWTWIEVDGENKPERIAISIDDAAMNSLDQGMEGGEGHHHENGLSLQFHPKASITPFTMRYSTGIRMAMNRQAYTTSRILIFISI